MIDRYIEESVKEIGRTKAQVLATIKNYEIADLKCSEVASEKLVAFAKELPVQPQTVGNCLSHLASIFTIARPAWGYLLDAQAMEDAFVVAKKLGLTSKRVERDRRPTLAELDLLMHHFGKIQAIVHSQTPCNRSLRSRFSAPGDREKSPALRDRLRACRSALAP